MAGGEGAAAYDLPNVPYVMYFYHDFGLHGAYWHDNFGHVMSHGCVNMRSVDAKVLFDWADGPTGNTLGTAVSVCDQITSAKQCIQNNPVQ
jgi:lipoprotein-anchoring transpeptidase ErfK/SrfK